MICLQRGTPRATLIDGRGAENVIVWLGRLVVRHLVVRHIVAMTHGIRLLTAALYTDEYLVVQTKCTVG